MTRVQSLVHRSLLLAAIYAVTGGVIGKNSETEKLKDYDARNISLEVGREFIVKNITNGRWSASYARCSPMTDSKRWKEGCVVKYRCYDGYVMVGGGDRTCTNGTWLPSEKPLLCRKQTMTTTTEIKTSGVTGSQEIFMHQNYNLYTIVLAQLVINCIY